MADGTSTFGSLTVANWAQNDASFVVLFECDFPLKMAQQIPRMFGVAKWKRDTQHAAVPPALPPPTHTHANHCCGRVFAPKKVSNSKPLGAVPYFVQIKKRKYFFHFQILWRVQFCFSYFTIFILFSCNWVDVIAMCGWGQQPPSSCDSAFLSCATNNTHHSHRQQNHKCYSHHRHRHLNAKNNKSSRP